MSFWIQVPAWGRPQNCIFAKKGNDASKGIVLFRDGADSSKATMRIGSGPSEQSNVRTGSNFQDSKWVHWCYVRKNNVGYWYRNGILDNYGNDIGDASSDQIIWIGYNQTWSTSASYNLKALRIYNRALSEKEVTELSNEFDVKYIITASDQTFRFTPIKNEVKYLSYSVIDGISINCEIISGSLEGSGVQLYMAAGKWSFYGKAPTDADHTYNLVVRFSGDGLIPKDINVTINTSATSDLSVPSPQTFNFTTEVESSKEISISTEDNADVLSFSYEGQPVIGAGCLTTRLSDTNRIFIETNGRQTSNQSVSKVIDFWTTYHPEHVQATININVTLNQITVADKEIKFYTADGSASQQVNYTSQNAITPVYTLSGTLPTGITFDSSTGTFTYDGTTTTPASGTVQVTVSSSTGASAPDTGTFTLKLIEGSSSIPTSGLVFYASLSNTSTTAETGDTLTFNDSGITATTLSGVPCLRFPGSKNQYISAPDTNMQFGSTINNTISLWMNTETVRTSWIGVFGYGKCYSNQQRMLSIVTGDQYEGSNAVIEADYNYANMNSNIPSYNVWHHVCFTSETSNGSTTGKIYIDGVLKSQITKTLNIQHQQNNLILIGQAPESSSPYIRSVAFAGYLAGVRIYNRVLTESEITQLSQEFTPTT